MAETFAVDAVTSYSDGELSFQGRDTIMKFLRESALGTPTGMIGVHHVHHPEIEMTGPTTANATWRSTTTCSIPASRTDCACAPSIMTSTSRPAANG